MRRSARPAALIVALLLLQGCGPKAITVGSRPFPADHTVFADAEGKPLAALPESGEPVRLVFLDFPWCPACADAWKSIRFAAAPFPPGTVRVFRVLFDRETLLSTAGKREVPPLPRTSAAGGIEPEDAETLAVTPLIALPGAFREEYRVSQAPVVLLLDGQGKVARRWIGFSAGLSRELASEIRKRSRPNSPRSPGT